MRFTTLAVALSLALLAACDRPSAQRNEQRPAAAGGSNTQGPQRDATTPNSPANIGAPTQAEKREGANPQQGQVDPKEPPQRKDFQKP